MANRYAKVSQRMIFTCLTLCGFIILFAPENFTNTFHFTFAQLFHVPLRYGRSTQLAHTGPRTENGYENYIATLEKYLSYYRKQVEKISKMRQRFPLKNFGLLPAAITVPDGPTSSFYINCGTDDGVIAGQFVLADNGIIGTVQNVSSHTAMVRLITDPLSKIGVQIGDLPERRMITGIGSNMAFIEMIPVKYTVKRKDKIFVAPKVKFLDDPIICGIVTDVTRNKKSPLIWDITVEPVCKIDQLESVHVLVFDKQ
ncbi:MAG: rod shape-determining protein MreC [Planctomycetota bacterium]